jgi:hypothetical protein
MHASIVHASIKHASIKHAACGMRHATCDMRHATCDMRACRTPPPPLFASLGGSIKGRRGIVCR